MTHPDPASLAECRIVRLNAELFPPSQEEREALTVHLANARLRLDSIRLVVIGG